MVYLIIGISPFLSWKALSESEKVILVIQFVSFIDWLWTYLFFWHWLGLNDVLLLQELYSTSGAGHYLNPIFELSFWPARGRPIVHGIPAVLSISIPADVEMLRGQHQTGLWEMGQDVKHSKSCVRWKCLYSMRTILSIENFPCTRRTDQKSMFI